MKIVRDLYPVGQGAFYKESFYEDNCKDGKSIFTIVYDCGSTKNDVDSIDNIIEQNIEEHSDIDILFISHFHEDHINGIRKLKEWCNIKNVVMPFLDEQDKNILLAYMAVTNYNSRNYSFKKMQEEKHDFIEIITNPEEYFYESKCYFISENENDSNSILENEFINNGICSIISAFWKYRTFVLRDSKYNNLYNDVLDQVGLDTLSSNILLEKLVDKNLFKEIRNIFKKYKADCNTYSMCLYSGPLNNINIINNEYLFMEKHSANGRLFLENIKLGCLYTGDYNAKDFYNELERHYISELHDVGLLQLPHHGSSGSFKTKLLNDDKCIYFMSYGLSNKYRHPGKKVINQLRKKQRNYLANTEKNHIKISTLFSCDNDQIEVC